LLGRLEIFDDNVKKELNLMAWATVEMQQKMQAAEEQGKVGEGSRSQGGKPGQGLASVMGRMSGGRGG